MNCIIMIHDHAHSNLVKVSVYLKTYLITRRLFLATFYTYMHVHHGSVKGGYGYAIAQCQYNFLRSRHNNCSNLD